MGHLIPLVASMALLSPLCIIGAYGRVDCVERAGDSAHERGVWSLWFHMLTPLHLAWYP